MEGLARLADRLTWELDLDNSAWLDITWKIPTTITHELVPAADLGVYVALAEGRYWPLSLRYTGYIEFVMYQCHQTR